MWSQFQGIRSVASCWLIIKPPDDLSIGIGIEIGMGDSIRLHQLSAAAADVDPFARLDVRDEPIMS